MFSSVCHTAKLFVENLSQNSNLDDNVISLPVFASITNPKMHNISVTPKIVKKVRMNLDLSKASGPDCIQAVVSKSCESFLRSLVFKIVGRFH